MPCEVLDADPDHDDAQGQGQVSVDEQVVSFIGYRWVGGRVVVVAFLEFRGTGGGGGVEVGPLERSGDDEPGDADGDGGGGPSRIKYPGGGAADGFPEHEDDQLPETLR